MSTSDSLLPIAATHPHFAPTLIKAASELDTLTAEVASLQVQRDQVLHLLQGGTLTEKQVTESGLGHGVLIEDRYAMRIVASLKALLRRLEWIDTGMSYRCCPICKCAVNFGHTPNCALAEAIKET